MLASRASEYVLFIPIFLNLFSIYRYINATILLVSVTEESECEGDESITRQEPGASSMSPQAQTATASIPEVEKESSMSLPGMGTRAILFYITHET